MIRIAKSMISYLQLVRHPLPRDLDQLVDVALAVPRRFDGPQHSVFEGSLVERIGGCTKKKVASCKRKVGLYLWECKAHLTTTSPQSNLFRLWSKKLYCEATMGRMGMPASWGRRVTTTQSGLL